ncbi:MAG: peptidylprolyl isomerase [Candidatus Latescibacterota bacterium]|nr:MAG: peptidylprolyl isomerase [Candidatus Latescibacterota bacterium]
MNGRKLQMSCLGRSLALAVCCWLCVGIWGSETAAEKILVDRVVAVVEDEPILQSDVDQAVKQFLIQRGLTNLGDAEAADLWTEALEELIGNKLVLAKASRLGITVSFAEVQKAVERAIEENKRVLGGGDAFNRQLEMEGLTLEGLQKLYREQIQNRMLVERVLAREIDREAVEITEEDLKDAFEKRKNDFPMRPDVVHLATIYLGLESSGKARAKALSEIEKLQDRILGGEDFAELAKEYSEDPSAETGGNLGKLKLEDLGNQEFAAAAAALAIGEVSDPVLTPFGYHLIQVIGADEASGEVELRHILIRIKPEEQDTQEVFERANEVHTQLLEGAPFDSMAVRYSSDQATAAQGGDLGWLRANELPDFFREVLREMEEGEISQVLREPTGFRIVKLLEREASRPYTFDEVREELKKLIEQEKVAETYDEYLRGLRNEFYVDVRAQ